MKLLSIAETANRLNVPPRLVVDVLRLNAVPGIKIHRVDGYRRVDESDLKTIRKAINRRRNEMPKPVGSSLLSHLAGLRGSTHAR
jgi:hypothetical protein